MSKITVLTFGAITEITHRSSFEVNDIASTSELKKRLENDFPALRNLQYAIAVNKQMVTTETALESGATIALLPPFSGG